ncbi:MAG: 50S ribosomal protein L25 [Gemmatimonadota bacterium]
MSQTATIPAQRRSATGKGVARKLRAAGRLPAVVYGGNDEPIHLSLDEKEASHLFYSISVDNTIVELEIEGLKGRIQTLVREIQTHPYRTEIHHVDFLRIQKGVKVELEIPVHLTGTPKGVKDEGGVLEQLIHSIHVRCIPSAIPEDATLDVSDMEIGDSRDVSHLALMDGVEVMVDPERTLCLVSAPRAVVEADEDADEAADAVVDVPLVDEEEDEEDQ